MAADRDPRLDEPGWNDRLQCAKGWPRMKFYRPKRYHHVTSVLRTPLPFAILVWAALVAAWGRRS
jgi:hypothetical protein